MLSRTKSGSRTTFVLFKLGYAANMLFKTISIPTLTYFSFFVSFYIYRISEKIELRYKTLMNGYLNKCIWSMYKYLNNSIFFTKNTFSQLHLFLIYIWLCFFLLMWASKYHSALVHWLFSRFLLFYFILFCLLYGSPSMARLEFENIS